jgi:hypothetical protein
MSQFYVNSAGVTPPPPTIPTSFVTDIGDNNPATSPGTAIPALNVLQILGRDNDQDNPNGIRTDADPNNGNIVYVELTNRIRSSGTTTDAVTPLVLYTFPLGATPGTYIFTQQVVAYNQTDSLGAVYSGIRGVRTTGAAGVLINANLILLGEEGTFSLVEVVNSISGNNAVLTITGIAGKTIDWEVLTTYIFVG